MSTPFTNRFIQFAAFFAAVIGLTVLTGWEFNLTYLKSPLPKLVTMNPLTAVNFVLTGIWISFYASKRRQIVHTIGLWLLPLFVLSTGLFKWSDSFFGTKVFVDRVLFADRIEYSQFAPTTTLNFVLLSLGMLCMLRPTKFFQKAFNVILTLALFIALFSFCGYLIGDTRIYIRKPFVPMALHTAITFVVCIFSLFFLYPNNIIVENFGSKHFGGVTARRIIPYVLLLPFLLEWLRLQGEKSNLFDAGFGVALQATTTSFIFLFLIWRSAFSLNRADIKRQQNERELEKAKLAAEEASQSKTRFLSSMSHEIRTPLNGVLGFADILATSDVSPDEQKEFLQHIKTSGELLLKLIGDILDINKIEAGKLVLENVSFPFSEYISSAIYPYKHTANEKGLDFKLIIDPTIPTFLFGDRHRINQVLVNLLGNAIKFTSSGYVGIQIDKLIEVEGRVDLRISVFDTGIGIEPDKQQKVFESFTQASDSVARHYGGSGLGLTIVKELLRLMNGTVRVSSPSPFGSVADFKGTCIELFLSLEVDKKAQAAMIPKKVEVVEGSRKKLNILVAEDNLLNQKIASYMLTKLGHQFHLAQNGEEAVKRVTQKIYDIVLMDIYMPVMNGYQATRLIRASGSTIPIIGLTANVFKDDIEQCIAAGMNDHLGKPYNEEQLLTVIEKWRQPELLFPTI